MSDVAGAEQASAETTTTQASPEVDIEARAFRMGWRPKVHISRESRPVPRQNES